MKIMPRRIVATLGVIVLVIGCYAGWQFYKGQQMSNQYAVDAQKPTQGSGNDSGITNSKTEITDEKSLIVSVDQTPSDASTHQEPSAPSAKKKSSAPVPHSDTLSSGHYKESMSKTYQMTIQAMQNIRNNTVALQSRKMSLSSYKASIVESQTTFSLAEDFVGANPPTDAKLNPSYQELLAGISLAKKATDVALNGISSYSISKFYTASEMGTTAQQQIVNGYSQL